MVPAMIAPGLHDIKHYRRSVPATTISAWRLPHLEQTNRSHQSRTGISAPYCLASSAGSGSTWWLHALHHTMSRTRAAAALPSVIGGPGCDFMGRRAAAGDGEGTRSGSHADRAAAHDEGRNPASWYLCGT
jgi:hypothetical protein